MVCNVFRFVSRHLDRTFLCASLEPWSCQLYLLSLLRYSSTHTLHRKLIVLFIPLKTHILSTVLNPTSSFSGKTSSPRVLLNKQTIIASTTERWQIGYDQCLVAPRAPSISLPRPLYLPSNCQAMTLVKLKHIQPLKRDLPHELRRSWAFVQALMALRSQNAI